MHQILIIQQIPLIHYSFLSCPTYKYMFLMFSAFCAVFAIKIYGTFFLILLQRFGLCHLKRWLTKVVMDTIIYDTIL